MADLTWHDGDRRLYPADDGQPRRLAWLTQALMVLASLALSVTLLEVGVRKARVFPRTYPAAGLFIAAPDTGYQMAPNYHGVYWKGGLAFTVRTNAQGFRDRRDFAAMSGTTRRVLVVGDSFVFGMPVEAQETFVARIEQRLNLLSRDHAWSVLNAGVPGYGTRQEALVLERLLPLTNPAAVVLAFYVGNDIQDNAYPPQAPASRAYHGMLVTPEVAVRAQSRVLDLWYRTRMWLRASVVESMAETLVDRFYASGDSDPFAALRTQPWSDELQRGWVETQRALTTIKELCLKFHTPLFVLVIPSKEEILAPSSAADLAWPRLRVLDLLNDLRLTAVDSAPWLLASSNHQALFETHGGHLLAPGDRIVGSAMANLLWASLGPGHAIRNASSDSAGNHVRSDGAAAKPPDTGASPTHTIRRADGATAVTRAVTGAHHAIPIC